MAKLKEEANELFRRGELLEAETRYQVAIMKFEEWKMHRPEILLDVRLTFLLATIEANVAAIMINSQSYVDPLFVSR